MRSGSVGAVCRFAVALALLVGTSITSIPASAQLSQASMKARLESDRLFKEGKRLYDEGKYKEACEALASSDELEPAIGTLGLLAACHEKEGDLVKAWKEYLETARRAEAKKDSRAEVAKQQAEALKARIARLSIKHAAREPGLEIRRDGDVLLESELGTEVKLNPGPHTIVARATGFPEWKKTVKLKEGELRVVEVPALDPTLQHPPQASFPGWVPWAVGGLGVVGIGVGTTAGVIAIMRNDESLEKSKCKPTAKVCLERNAALTAATVSTVAFSVGGAGVAAGAVLFFVHRSQTKSASPKTTGLATPSSVLGSIDIVPSVGAGSAGAVIVGVF